MLRVFLPQVWPCRSPSLVEATGKTEVLPHHLLFKKNLHHSVTSHFNALVLVNYLCTSHCLFPPKYTMKRQSRKCLPRSLRPAKPRPGTRSEELHRLHQGPALAHTLKDSATYTSFSPDCFRAQLAVATELDGNTRAPELPFCWGF